MSSSTPNAALGGTTPATKRPHESEPESDRQPSKVARTGAGGLDGGVSDITEVVVEESATKSTAAEESTKSAAAESATEEAATEEATTEEATTETQLARLESAAVTLNARGADALDSGTAERLRGIAMSLWKLNDTFKQREAARKEAAAAGPTDDTFSGPEGCPRVRLELDIVEQIMLQLSPKDMAVAARVNRHFLQAVERAIPARLRPPPPPPKPGKPQLPNDPRRLNLGLAVDADEKVTTGLLARLEQQVKQVREAGEVPSLLERSEVDDLRTLASFHHSVLHSLLDDERLLQLLKVDDLSGAVAWRIVVNGKPTPAWVQRNKSAVEAALRASGPNSTTIQTYLCLLFHKMPTSVAEEHVEDIGALLARIAETALGSGSPLQIEQLLDLLARLSTPALARIRAKIDECWSACQANHAFNHLAVAPKVRALLAQANGTSI
ncbi:hypothetical protein EMIHUDRAFT_117067 [Emiliania huxleyi CCMP1516]|uniref:F-box domain-containing protein n=2 Tax=Emiliania huxleyi TaxID=2903 RepID=A0A0D3JDM0_EMIH1|nr:hypothetical protein EMIHUDRAFT_117067 [Emiliania huxleyi CCMP1516]EOD21605.1 hypothetical protein EMIHUDRAFT_117067 [Emiliania huxleyi CCMP1516]|eukprot:XP_005774034.1 hypothetical protein EMIHUDRAFT_117067 [Emiliania huxleyi CCMP1516]